jgi:hypothetical protein
MGRSIRRQSASATYSDGRNAACDEQHNGFTGAEQPAGHCIRTRARYPTVLSQTAGDGYATVIDCLHSSVVQNQTAPV